MTGNEERGMFVRPNTSMRVQRHAAEVITTFYIYNSKYIITFVGRNLGIKTSVLLTALVKVTK